MERRPDVGNLRDPLSTEDRFFFSSRRRHTRWTGDWSSDVCSSDLIEREAEKCPEAQRLRTHPGVGALTALAFVLLIGDAERFHCGKQVASYLGLVPLRSEERRVGKECRTRGWRYH